MAAELDSSCPEYWERRFLEGRTPWDAGGPPRELVRFLDLKAAGGRVLVPGCGAAHEALAFHQAAYQVTAIDFSEAACEAARATLGELASLIQLGDFFTHELELSSFDLVYERAFLCSLPRTHWARYVARVAELLKPSGLLIGLFFFDAAPEGPPYGLTGDVENELMGQRFALEVDEIVAGSAAVFAGKERWQEWRLRERDGGA